MQLVVDGEVHRAVVPVHVGVIDGEGQFGPLLHCGGIGPRIRLDHYRCGQQEGRGIALGIHNEAVLHVLRGSRYGRFNDEATRIGHIEILEKMRNPVAVPAGTGTALRGDRERDHCLGSPDHIGRSSRFVYLELDVTCRHYVPRIVHIHRGIEYLVLFHTTPGFEPRYMQLHHVLHFHIEKRGVTPAGCRVGGRDVDGVLAVGAFHGGDPREDDVILHRSGMQVLGDELPRILLQGFRRIVGYIGDGYADVRFPEYHVSHVGDGAVYQQWHVGVPGVLAIVVGPREGEIHLVPDIRREIHRKEVHGVIDHAGAVQPTLHPGI